MRRWLSRLFRRKPIPPTIHVTIGGDPSHLAAAIRRAQEQIDRVGRRPKAK